MIRVVVLMVVATAVWVPIGVWLGLRPTWARRAQPVAQFLAAFPANLFFPIFVVAIVHWNLSPDIWLTPLMVLGAQWYILFNVIAGAAAFPGDLLEASKQLPHRRAAVVAPGDPAGHLLLLHHGRDHRLGRRLERRHRVRGRELGAGPHQRARARRLYRAGQRRR